MPVYNFTARVTDNASAFADRDFSINIRNTNVGANYVASKGANTAAYGSVDGVSWYQLTGGFGDSVCFCNNRWITYNKTSTNTDCYYTSNTDTEWVKFARPTFYVNSYHYPPIAHGNGLWMTFGIGPSGYNDQCYTSTDGITWQAAGNIPSDGGAAKQSVGGDVIFANGKWIALCADWAFSETISPGWYSEDDGATWQNITLPGSCLVRNACYANGKWHFVVNPNQNYGVLESLDLINWVNRTLPGTLGKAPSWYGAFDITYGNGTWFVTSVISSGGPTTGWYSRNGVTWQTSTNLTSPNTVLSRCQYGKGKFIVYNSTGIYYSTDAVTWVKATTGSFTDVACRGLE